MVGVVGGSGGESERSGRRSWVSSLTWPSSSAPPRRLDLSKCRPLYSHLYAASIHCCLSPSCCDPPLPCLSYGVGVLLLLVHVVVVLPGFRDERQDSLRQGLATRQSQVLDGVVQAAGVRVAQLHDRVEILLLHVEIRGLELAERETGLPGAHFVCVPPQRVDLAVVGEHAKGLGALPAGEGVRGESCGDDDETTLESGILGRREEI